VVVNGTEVADTATVTGGQDGVSVSGLPALVNVTGADASDALAVNGLGGDDTLDATGLPAGIIALTLNGGPGDDVLSGGPGTVQIP
jgi:hypothetical protein